MLIFSSTQMPSQGSECNRRQGAPRLNQSPLNCNATADMPGADDLMMRIYAAMAQKERELISERTRAAAKARGARLGGDRATGQRSALTAVQQHCRAVRPQNGRRTGCCWKWTGCAIQGSRRAPRWRGL
jgi:hypothetical protein